MKIAFISLLLLFLPVTSLAEVGDTHTIKAEVAFVHASADKNSPQVEKLERFAQVMEMDVQGQWYEIYIASSDLSGWMHVSALAIPEADSGTSPAPEMTLSRSHMAPKRIVKLKIKDSEKTSAMKEFEKYLLKYNARTHTLNGYTPFTKVEPLVEDGNLQVTVTEQWLKQSRAKQKSSLITLYAKWKNAINNIDSKVIAVDSIENEVLSYPE